MLRRAPAEHVPHAAAMTALAAYLAGDGALAWCAIDRVNATGLGHPVARAVADNLDNAVAPTEWGA
ncbi:DUF4192 family protein [Nocardioides alcanivorans]|uniref:DUF4192 family protein n=1 Tax=Nocardioides alcanivorans TaxID=2897352 RepID=UPI0028972957|nr:DUF4192 family protein [Nocardioides alcanivorans]